MADPCTQGLNLGEAEHSGVPSQGVFGGGLGLERSASGTSCVAP